jgi:hypothetical protein
MMKRVLILSIFLFLALVSFKDVAYALSLEPAVPVEVDETNMEKAGMKIGKRVETIIRPNVEYKATGLRNPFEQPVLGSEDNADGSLVAKEATLPSLTVQGIIWEGSPKQAIINNKVVKVGDTLESVDIVDINKEGVTVLFAGVEHKLTTAPAMGQQADLED